MELNLIDRLGNPLLEREIEDPSNWGEIEEVMREMHGQCKTLAGELHFGAGNVKVDQFVLVCTTEEYGTFAEKDGKVPTFEREGSLLKWRVSAQRRAA